MKLSALYAVLPALFLAGAAPAAPAKRRLLVQILYTQVSPAEMKSRHVNAHQAFDGPQGYRSLRALTAKRVLRPKLSLGPRVLVAIGQSATSQELSVVGARVQSSRITAGIGLRDAEQQILGQHGGLRGVPRYTVPSGDAVLLRRSYLAGAMRLTWAYVSLYPAPVIVRQRPKR